MGPPRTDARPWRRYPVGCVAYAAVGRPVVAAGFRVFIRRMRVRHGGVPVNDLIDTTEMYLRTIFELEEEGIVPLRARIAERLHQSGPTVSQTVARMERDGLLRVEGDRHLQLSDEGRA